MTLPRSRALFAASLHRRNERMQFQKITLWNSFSRLCSFGGSSTPLSCKSKSQNAIKMFGFVQKNIQALASSCACVCVFFLCECVHLFLPDLSLLGCYSRCYFYTSAKCFEVCANLCVCCMLALRSHRGHPICISLMVVAGRPTHFAACVKSSLCNVAATIVNERAGGSSSAPVISAVTTSVLEDTAAE